MTLHPASVSDQSPSRGASLVGPFNTLPNVIPEAGIDPVRSATAAFRDRR